MFARLFTGTAIVYVSLLTMATTSYASPSEPVTVDVYGSSYNVELDHEATDQVLRNQPWWGNKQLASELCEALVYQGDDVASVGFNTMEINGEDYIEAYLVMPLATCSGPVVISQADIGQMAGGTFVVVSGNICLTSATDTLSAYANKDDNPELIYQTISAFNCNYFDNSILY